MEIIKGAKNGVALTFVLPLTNSASRPDYKAAPTIALGDVKVARYTSSAWAVSNVALARINAITGLTTHLEIELTAAEMTADNDTRPIVVSFIDAAGGEWDADTVEIRLGPIEANMTQIGGDSVVGNAATLTLKQLDIQNVAGDALIVKSTGGNGKGLVLAGHGTSPAAEIDGGATAAAIVVNAGSCGDRHAVVLNANDAGGCLVMQPGANGYGLDILNATVSVGARIKGGSSGGTAVQLDAPGSGGSRALSMSSAGDATLLVSSAGGNEAIAVVGSGSVPAIDVVGGSSKGIAVRLRGGTGSGGTGQALVLETQVSAANVVQIETPVSASGSVVVLSNPGGSGHGLSIGVGADAIRAESSSNGHGLHTIAGHNADNAGIFTEGRIESGGAKTHGVRSIGGGDTTSGVGGDGWRSEGYKPGSGAAFVKGASGKDIDADELDTLLSGQTALAVQNAAIIVDTTQLLVDTAAIIVDTTAIIVDTTALLAAIGTPSNLGGGATLADNAADMAGSSFNSSTDSQEAASDAIATLDTAVGALPDAAATADAVWDETLSGHVGAGSAGKTLSDVPDADANADAIWEEDITGHTGADKAGQVLADGLTEDNFVDLSFERDVQGRFANQKPSSYFAGTGTHKKTIAVTQDGNFNTETESVV
jgi:hypothetical protein